MNPAGLPLKLFLALAESSLFSPLRRYLLRSNNIPQTLDEKSYACEPLYRPDTAGFSPELKHRQGCIEQDADGCTTAAAVAVSLDLSKENPSSARCSALEFHAAYLSKTVTPTDVAEAFILAVEESEKMSPPMRVFIDHRPAEIRVAAAASTERYASGTPLSVLDGVLFGVKDELDVEGYPTTAGTAFIGKNRLVEGTIPGVTALLEAGAILAGKLNMHEIGLGTTGLNTVHGTPRNPYNVDYHTGGSSSGAAAAVASGLLPFAIGTDGGGSVRIPSALCGIVGLKPTCDRVCHHPSPPMTATVSVCGPLAFTVRDCALLYAMLANKGHAQHGVLTVPPPLALPTFSPSAAGLVAGVHWKYLEHSDPEIVSACKHAIEVLKKAGMTIKPISIPYLNELRVAHSITISSEMRAHMSEYVSNASTRRQLNADVRISLALADGFSAGGYVSAQKIRRQLDTAVRRIFEDENIDFIITPTTPSVAPKIRPASLTGGVSDVETTVKLMRFAQLANVLGLPAISVPVGSASASGGTGTGKNKNSEEVLLPVGLQIMARPWHEASLFHIAEILESSIDLSELKPQAYWNILEKAKNK